MLNAYMQITTSLRYSFRL